MTPLLTTRGLSRSFGGLKAVDNVDFDVMPGEIRAVIGPNGAGKTTFVSLICGRISADAGRIDFDGQDITDLPAYQRVRKGIAYTFQITSVFANLSAYDNVALAVQRSMLDAAEARQSGKALRGKAMEALRRTGLEDRADAQAGTLSYGHQRLLEVAMGLALKPRLLILDEPTQGLSDAEIVDFIALIREIAKTATVLLIEHNMQVVMQLAHRVSVFEAGRMIADDIPDAIRENPVVQHAYLGDGPDE